MASLPEKTKAREGKNENSMDRISSLPDEVLHYILSLSDLQMFDVVKMSVLSKRWNRLFTTMPYLHFNLARFYRWPSYGVEDFAKFETLKSFIDWVLISLEDSPIVHFSLYSQRSYNIVQVLRWLRAVAKRNVKELDINFDPAGAFKLPLFIAASESLEVLKMELYSNVLQLPTHIRLNRLRQLDLINIEFTDSDLIQRLVSGCSVLETLNLVDCKAKNFNSLRISSTSIKLLNLGFMDDADISNCEITVSCPSLTEFTHFAPVAKRYILQNASRLEYAQIDFWDIRKVLLIPKVGQTMYEIVKSVCHVTALSLHYRVVPCLYYVIDNMLRCPITFHKVKSLTLKLSFVGIDTQVMFLLVDHCPNLEVLSLYFQEWDDPEDEEQWQLDHEGIVSWKSHPHLKTINLFYFKEYGLDFLKFLLKNANNLEKLNVISERNESCPSLVKAVPDFIRASLNCKVKFRVQRP